MLSKNKMANFEFDNFTYVRNFIQYEIIPNATKELKLLRVLNLKDFRKVLAWIPVTLLAHFHIHLLSYYTNIYNLNGIEDFFFIFPIISHVTLFKQKLVMVKLSATFQINYKIEKSKYFLINLVKWLSPFALRAN